MCQVRRWKIKSWNLKRLKGLWDVPRPKEYSGEASGKTGAAIFQSPFVAFSSALFFSYMSSTQPSKIIPEQYQAKTDCLAYFPFLSHLLSA